MKEVYKMTGRGAYRRATDKTVDEKYLIATSKKLIAAFHCDYIVGQGKWINARTIF